MIGISEIEFRGAIVKALYAAEYVDGLKAGIVCQLAVAQRQRIRTGNALTRLFASDYLRREQEIPFFLIGEILLNPRCLGLILSWIGL